MPEKISFVVCVLTKIVQGSICMKKGINFLTIFWNILNCYLMEKTADQSTPLEPAQLFESLQCGKESKKLKFVFEISLVKVNKSAVNIMLVHTH